MLAAIYCRLSKEDPDREETGKNSESIMNQMKLLEDYASKNSFQIYDYYIDEDRSGMDRERPGFLRLIRDAEAGAFQVLLCKTQSRFTRDMELVEKYIHGLFPLWGIRFISVVETYDTAVKGNKKARQISALINEWYCEDLSENIRAVFRKKMQDGEFIGSFACYGYKKSAEDKHKLVIDEEAAEVVKYIYDMYLKGHSCVEIADMLSGSGTLTPTAWKRRQGLLYSNPAADGGGGETSCMWSVNTIKRILSNETYTGVLVQGREQKVSYKSRKMRTVPKKEWIKVPKHHEAVISDEVFRQAEIIRQSRKNAPLRLRSDAYGSCTSIVQHASGTAKRSKCHKAE